MRRAANLFDQIPEPENLRLAFHKAARGRRGQAVVQQFAASRGQRVAAISEAIREGTFPVGRFLKGAPSSILKGGTRNMPGPLFGGTMIAVSPYCVMK